MEEFVDNKSKVDQMEEFVPERRENIFFAKALFTGSLKLGTVW